MFGLRGDCGGSGNLLRRFMDNLAIRNDPPRGNCGLRPCAALEYATLDQKAIGAFSFTHVCRWRILLSTRAGESSA
jgi:hypothetical protein